MKIGSIALLGETAVLSSKSLRLTDWLLLMLRCLLLIMLVFVLCKPFIDEKIDAAENKGWIVIKEPALKSVYFTNRKIIDSLLLVGYKLHDFDLGFKSLELKDTSAKQSISGSAVPDLGLLRQMNATLPTGFNVFLFSDQFLSDFNGTLPALQINLKWIAGSTGDSIGKWTTTFAGKFYDAKSSSSQTVYTQKGAALEGTQTLRVAIRGGSNTADERYIRAALTAISDFTKRSMQVKHWEPSGNEVPNYDVVFWLSEEAPNERLTKGLKKGAKIFRYKKGRITNASSVLHANAGWQELGSPQIYKRIVAKDSENEEKIWEDQFGAPLLVRKQKDGIEEYLFYFKINQEWTDLVWENTFVKSLMPLVVGFENEPMDLGFENHPLDKRIRLIDTTDLKRNDGQVETKPALLSRPVSMLFWLAAIVFFLIERILSFRKQVRLSYE